MAGKGKSSFLGSKFNQFCTANAKFLA